MKLGVESVPKDALGLYFPSRYPVDSNGVGMICRDGKSVAAR